MIFEIFYHPKVEKEDWLKIQGHVSKAVRSAIENKLMIGPEIFGLPLRGVLKHHFKLRVGDLRIIYSIKDHRIFILIIGHRRNVYKMANKRSF